MPRPSDAELARHRTIDLTTIGRRSGRPSRIEIWWFYIEGTFIITGTPGARDWYANVLADPNVSIHVAGLDHRRPPSLWPTSRLDRWSSTPS